MNEHDREKHIAHFKRLMEESFNAGNRGEAKFYCRVWTGLLRGRKPKKEQGAA